MTFQRHAAPPKPSTASWDQAPGVSGTLPKVARTHHPPSPPPSPPPPPAEVVKKRLSEVMNPGKGNHYQGSVVMLARPGGGIVLHPHQLHALAVQSPAYLGAATFAACLVLALLGCVLFRVCKKSRRTSSQDSVGSGPEAASGTAALPQPGGEEIGGGGEDVSRSLSSDSEEAGELRHLTAGGSGGRNVTPPRYCLLPADTHSPSSPSSASLGGIIDAAVVETSFAGPVEGTNGIAATGVEEDASICGACSDAGEQSGLGTREVVVDDVAKVHGGPKAADVVIVVTENKDNCHTSSATNGSDHRMSYAHNEHSDSHDSEKILLGTECRNMSPLTECRNLSPLTECRNLSPLTECRNLSPTDCRNLSPLTECRNLSPLTECRNLSPLTECRNLSPLTECRNLSPLTECRNLSPLTECRNLSPETDKDLSPETDKDISPHTDIKDLSSERDKDMSPHTDIKDLSPHTDKDLSPETDIKDLSPQTDASSDVSEYLATLVLEVNSENSDDVTEGERTQEGCLSLLTPDHSPLSPESFGRLKDVKAQAEFSPYHIAWSTPLFPQHPSTRLRQLHKVPAAKRLNMDVANGGPPGLDPLPEQPPGLPGQSRSYSTYGSQHTAGREGGSPPEDPGNPAETSQLFAWGLWKPQDAWCRPVSAEYRTPRPVGNKRGIFRSLTDVSADREQQQPLLPYSVAEYRRSLKNLVLAAGGSSSSVSVGTKDPESLYDIGTPPSSPRSSGSQPTPLLTHLAARTPVGALSGVDGSSGESGPQQDTLQSQPCQSAAMDSTLAGLAEITDSSVGDWSSSLNWSSAGDCVPSRDHKTPGQHVLSDNDNSGGGDEGGALHGEERSWLQGQPNSPPSLPSSATSSSVTASSEADQLSSMTTSSVERFLQCRLSSNPCTGQVLCRSRTTQKAGPGFLAPLSPRRLSMLSRSKSTSETLEVLDNFKVPYPVSAVTLLRVKDGMNPGLTRSRSSTHKPLTHGSLLEPGQMQLRRSRTSESVGSVTDRGLLQQQQLLSVGSWSDVRSAGSSASHLSLQEPSLAWDNEFTASCGKEHDDSLSWEEDPCLT